MIMIVEAKFGFLEELVSLTPLILGVFDLDGDAAVTLRFEDLAVKNYLLLKDMCICW